MIKLAVVTFTFDKEDKVDKTDDNEGDKSSESKPTATTFGSQTNFTSLKTEVWFRFSCDVYFVLSLILFEIVSFSCYLPIYQLNYSTGIDYASNRFRLVFKRKAHYP